MGADVISGGASRDYFVFENIAETSYVLGGSTIYDRIVDFSSAQGDKMSIPVTIDANGDGVGNGTFSSHRCERLPRCRRRTTLRRPLRGR